jgi:hypothetical protein
MKRNDQVKNIEGVKIVPLKVNTNEKNIIVKARLIRANMADRTLIIKGVQA